jgi:hypothetical protein
LIKNWYSEYYNQWGIYYGNFNKFRIKKLEE